MKGEDQLGEENQGNFRELVEKIGWITNTWRPDLYYDKIILSTKVGKATVNDFKQTLKILKKLKSKTTEMKFPNLGPVADWTLQGYGDAGFKSLPDKVSSCGGQVVAISNKKMGLKCVISWRSWKFRRVVSSSTAAEAVNDTLDELIYIKEVLTNKLWGKKVPQFPLNYLQIVGIYIDL